MSDSLTGVPDLPTFLRYVGDTVSFTRSGRVQWDGVSLLRRRDSGVVGSREEVERLARAFYTTIYTQGGIRREPPAPALWISGPQAEARFVAQLSSANQSPFGWDSGWRLVPDSSYEAVTNGLLIAGLNAQSIGSEAILSHNNGVVVSHPRESTVSSPGHYAVFGSTTPDDLDSGYMVRAYFNVRLSSAVSWLSLLTSALEEANFPFWCKILSKPSGYPRNDAAVVYVSSERAGELGSVLRDINKDLARHLREGTPALTKKLMPGVGLAEDTIDGESFGLTICRAVAKVVIARRPRNRDAVDACAGGIMSEFESLERNAETPFLRLGSVDRFSLGAGFETPEPAPRTTVDLQVAVLRGREHAFAVAQELADTAIWERDECTWLGRDLGAGDAQGGGAAVYRPVGSDLYTGSAGVGLFLAEATVEFDNHVFAKTAAATLRHALRSTPTGDPASAAGLYTGDAGVALAGLAVGGLLSDVGLVEESLASANRIIDRTMSGTRPREHDLLSGSAGMILALLCIAYRFQSEGAIRAAVILGDHLVKSARRHPDGSLSWGSPSGGYAEDLVGLAHGAGGIAVALLELARITGSEHLRQVGWAALRYEDRWYDEGLHNWPRFNPLGASLPRFDFAVQWCHGAPGVAVSRQRAIAIGSQPEADARRRAAITRTLDWCESFMPDGTASLNLCHGLAGNADVILSASRDSSDSQGTLDRPIQRAVGKLLEESKSDLRHLNERLPSLMLGEAGIGHFLLRASSDRVPSVLAIDPSRFLSR